jgi:hypothetical protein
MSTLKTTDNAALPGPVRSPGREPKAKGRKMVATSQSLGARQTKKQTVLMKRKDASRRKIASGMASLKHSY